MSSVDHGAASSRPADVELWLAGLGLEPVERAERDGITSWDLVLDGRRRFDLRVTVILDPSLAIIVWAHYAPPIGDMFRKSYRKLLRWNDEFPFAKFSVSEDERPVLAVEVPIAEASGDALGIALARILGMADRLLDETAGWLWLGGRIPDQGDRVGRNEAFLARYEAVLPELLGPGDPADDAVAGADPAPATADPDEQEDA
jgi:Putative bacterial sensory transduction regulator